MTVSEKACYIKGLLEGMNYNKDSNEGKLFTAILDLLEDLALSVQDLEDETAMLNDYIEEIDEDLGEVEKDFYECDDDCDCDCDCDDDCDCGCEDCDFDCDFDCDNCKCECDCEDCVEELECPACGEMVYIDSEEIDNLEKVVCPHCNAECDIVCTDEECGCGCDCGCEE